MNNWRRRRFLGTALASFGGASLAGLGGCSLLVEPNRLRISGLTGSIPGRMVGEFEKVANKSAEFKSFKNYSELWDSIKEGKDLPDSISLADGWLDQAIANSLIQSLSLSEINQKIPQWSELAPQFQASVTRNGRVWGIPYRWGATAIAYRSDKVDQPISKWEDLWRSDLRAKITLPNNQREVIGIILKKLGQSYQTVDLDSIAELKSELKSLHRQVKAYTNQHYLQPLLTGDSWVAVGWTIDLLRIQQLYPDIQIILPSEGTAIWTDIWTTSLSTKNLTSAYAWQNFFLSPAIAAKISALTDVAATIPALDLLPQSVKQNSVKFPSADILAKSELLLPLPAATVKQYQKIWQTL